MTESSGPIQSNARLEAFSDGVFAIAITLLVLELKVPELEERSGDALRRALLAQWPAYLGFLTSFLTILIIWVNHHALFRQLRGHTRPLLFANGLLLLVVTLIPFPTSLVSGYILTPGAGIAALVYCALQLGLALAFNLIWSTAYRSNLLLADTQSSYAQIRRGYRVGPVLYGLAVIVSLPFPLLGVGICAGLAVFFAALSYER